MNMKFLKTILSVVLFAVIATSCNNNNNSILHDNYIEYEFTGNFSVIHKKSLDKSTTIEGTTYKFRWRSDFTADVYVYNAKFSAMMPDGVNIEFEGLKWTFVDEVKSISLKDVVPTKVTMNGNDVDVSTYVLNELKVNVYERRLLNFKPEYMPVINVSMSMGDIEVISVQKQMFYFGTTGVVNNQESNYFSTKSPIYLVSLDHKTKIATMDIYQAKFAENMPAMDMKFDSIPFEVSNVGYTLAVDEVIPTIGDVPYPNYAIKSLSGRADFATGLDLRFDCMHYSTTAKLGYPIPAELK